MPQITVWQCPRTKKIFLTQPEYTAHLRKEAAKTRVQRRQDKARDTFSEWLRNEKETQVLSMEDVVPWLLKNQQMIMDAVTAKAAVSKGWCDRFYETDKFEKILMDSLPRYDSNLSNSHSAPAGGVQNWCAQKKDLPTGYPGYGCRISGKLARLAKHMSQYPYSDFLNIVGIHTLCGGGGNESWGYDANIFLEDWPGIKQGIVFAKLQG
jgi:hypothetical protein